MTTYKEGDIITATHPDGYTVSGPLRNTGNYVALELTDYAYRTVEELECDGYTITPGKPADLSNPTDAQARAAMATYVRSVSHVTIHEAMKAALKAAAAVVEPVKVPTGVGAVVKDPITGTHWHQLADGRWFTAPDDCEPVEVENSNIANILRNGGKVLSEGVEL